MNRTAGLAAGWARPERCEKYHYFPAGEPKSLCSKWLFMGNRWDEAHDLKINCGTCKKRRLAALKTAVK